MNILHVSDLHFSRNDQFNVSIILEAFFKDISIYIEKGNSIDLIIFSGDLVFSGSEKEDFEAAKLYFIDKLLQICKLNYDYFISVPGNHDVQREQIDHYSEAGYKEILSNRDAVNNLIRKDNDLVNAISRLDNYNSFSNKFISKYLTEKHHLYKTYSFTDSIGNSVGVMALNSSWRARGGSEDYGKLLVGEIQLEMAFQKIKECKVKVAVLHHPFEWLRDFDRQLLKSKFLKEINLLFLGHNHEQESLNLSSSLSEQFVICNGGCLYDSRDYFNGYALAKISTDNMSVLITHRTYYSNRKEFDKSINYNSGEEKEFSFSGTGKQDKAKYELSQLESYEFEEQTNASLISSSLDTVAPKKLIDIFVTPKLNAEENKSRDTELAFTEEKSQPIDIVELYNNEINYIIKGKKESGKTTLLKYICICLFRALQKGGSKIPVFINFNDIKGKKGVFKLVQNFVNDNFSIIKSSLPELLTKGSFCILIDDFEKENDINIQEVESFISQFPKNKYIICQIDKSINDVTPREKKKFSVDFKECTIKPFNRISIKKFAENWFRDSDVDVEEIFEKIMLIISEANLPKNPTIISFILWILEKQKNYMPLNKASVVEKFVETLLDKLNATHTIGNKNMPDFRIKEHYLSVLCQEMVVRNTYQLKRIDLEKITLDYFEKKKINYSPSKFIDYFIDKGILFTHNEIVSFKIMSFCEFFIAKRAIEDIDFCRKYFFDTGIVDFVAPVDFLTGLQRNNTELLNYIYDKTIIAFEQFEKDTFKIDLNEIDSLDSGVEEPIGDQELLLKKMRESRESVPQKTDEIISELEDTDDDDFSQPIRNVSNKLTTGVELSSFLTLLSTTLKNCELIDFIEKKEKLNTCLSLWGKFIFITLFAAEEGYIKDQDEVKKVIQINDVSGRDNYDEEELKNFFDNFIKVAIPMVIQQRMFELFGSHNLEEFLKQNMDQEDQQPLFIQYLTVFLYGNLKFPSFVAYLKKFISKIKNKNYLLRLTHMSIYSYYLAKRKIDPNQKIEIERIIIDLHIDINKMSTNKGSQSKIDKSKLFNQLRKNKLRADFSDDTII